MDLGLIRKLVRLMERAELTELEIDDTNAGMRVHLCRGGNGGAAAPVVHVLPGAASAVPAMPAMPGTNPAGGGAAEDAHPPGTVPFESPMVGTFYRASSPDSDPFVSAGTTIDEESVVCIIEAMKVMNEVKAEIRGEVVEVLVENGEPVEFGQPLFLIKPA